MVAVAFGVFVLVALLVFAFLIWVAVQASKPAKRRQATVRDADGKSLRDYVRPSVPVARANPTPQEKAIADGKTSELLAMLPSMPTVDLTSKRDHWIGTVGESFHQDALKMLKSVGREDATATFVAEPWNPWDAASVLVAIDGAQVGHFSRYNADLYADVVVALRNAGKAGTCRAQLRGGSGAKTFVGVTLNLLTPAACLKRIEKFGAAPSSPTVSEWEEDF